MLRPVLEYGGACDQNVSPGGNDLLSGFGCDAAIDLEVDRAFGVANHFADVADFIEQRDEALATEAGVDGHDQHEVHHVHDVRDGCGGGGGVQRYARFDFMRFDRLKGAVKMRSGFLMDGDDVCTRRHEIGDQVIDGGDHEVDVENLFAVRAQAFDDRRAEGEVGHEMAVHHVDMDVIGSGLVNRPHLFAQLRKIGGEDGGGDADGAGSGHGFYGYV